MANISLGGYTGPIEQMPIGMWQEFLSKKYPGQTPNINMWKNFLQSYFPGVNSNTAPPMGFIRAYDEHVEKLKSIPSHGSGGGAISGGSQNMGQKNYQQFKSFGVPFGGLVGSPGYDLLHPTGTAQLQLPQQGTQGAAQLQLPSAIAPIRKPNTNYLPGKPLQGIFRR